MKRIVFVLAAVGLASPAGAQAPPSGPGTAWLGVTYDIRWIQKGTECTSQLVLQGVVPGSPADRAGLRAGDAIVAIQGDPVPARRLPLLAARLAPGDSVRLTIERGGSSRAVMAIADRRPDRPPAMAQVAAPERPNGPTIVILGDSLVATNVPAATLPGQGAQGYWLSSADGRAVYRTLPARPRSDLDRRVANLMGCVTEFMPPGRLPAVEVEQLQMRADSLRLMIARRVLEHQGMEAHGLRQMARARDAVPARPAGPAAMVLFRSAGSSGLQHIAGADLVVMEPELAEYFRGARGGLLILRVAPGSAAERSGLRPGDVVTGLGGRSIRSAEDLRGVGVTDGQPLDLSIVRQGRARTVTVPLQQ